MRVLRLPMRRRIDIEPKSLFQGREFARLMTLFIMLGVIGMLMVRAKDPDTWAFFDTTPEEQMRVADVTAAPKEGGKPDGADSTLTKIEPHNDSKGKEGPDQFPLDEDPAERDSLSEELEAITDKEPMQAIESPAYYRLVRWTMSQSVEEMQRKAQKNVPFGSLLERPNAYRSKLIDIRLKVRRVQQYPGLEAENPAGIDSLWELLGYNNSSGINFYTCVTPSLPGGVSVGPSVTEDGRFVGYFLKLQAYEDGEGKNRATPVLIGRFIWDPPISQKADPEKQRREFLWGLTAVAAVCFILVLRWAIRRIWPDSNRAKTDIGLQELRRRRSLRTGFDDQTTDIETWLSQSEPSGLDPAINPSDPPESEGK